MVLIYGLPLLTMSFGGSGLSLMCALLAFFIVLTVFITLSSKLMSQPYSPVSIPHWFMTRVIAKGEHVKIYIQELVLVLFVIS